MTIGLIAADGHNNFPNLALMRLSCDTSDMLPVIEQAAAYLREAGVAKSRLWAYALVQDVEEAPPARLGRRAERKGR